MDILGGILDYGVGWAIVAGIYAVFSLGLNVHWGYTGLFNIGIAGFFAIGAYTSALLSTASPNPALFEDFIFGGDLPARLGIFNAGIDLWFPICLIAAAISSGILATIIGLVTIRLREDYLAITTLGIAEIIRLIFLNEKWLANGSRGLYNIPKFLGDLVQPANYNYLYIVVVFCVLGFLYFAVTQAINSPWGRVIRAIRENETTVRASGKNILRFKLQAFILGAAIMGVGGALYAHNIRFVSPITFDPLLATFVIWAMLMVGGSGNNRGAILGAFVVWGIWAGTQFLPGFISNPDVRLFMIGSLIVVAILLKPGGILPEKRKILGHVSTSSENTPTK